jgi:hypothetical protein
MISDELRFPYLEKSLHILRPWIVYFDSNVHDRSDSLSKDQLEYLLQQLCILEHRMARITMVRSQYDVSEGHCQRCLSYSRRMGIEGEKKTFAIFNALSTYVTLRQQQSDDTGAVRYIVLCTRIKVHCYHSIIFSILFSSSQQ